jgi:uncharacterized membrane protein YhhN
VAIALTIACALALAALLLAEHRRSRSGKLATKPLASAAFIAVGLCAWPLDSGYAQWIALGLVLGAAGDVALIFARGFTAGLGLFLAGHVAYVIACAQLVAPVEWPSWAALAPLVASALALGWLWPHLGRLRVAVVLYIAAICAMVVAALAVGEARLVTGAVLFFVSDLAVARERFVRRGFVNRAWGLPAYYSGQLLIAWSLLG